MKDRESTMSMAKQDANERSRAVMGSTREAPVHAGRRLFLVRGAGIGVASLALPFLSGALQACGGDKELKCDDVSELSGSEREMRENLKYVDKSPHADKYCLNCTFYQAAPAEGKCGGCTLLKGPIHPQGYCSSWAAKQG